MTYLYYPGCSLEGTAMEYNAATQVLMEALGAELAELPDWTCCGASAAEASSYWLSLALPARNLALAEQLETSGDLLVPCSACYLNLKKVEQIVYSEPSLQNTINEVLSADGLQLNSRLRVRHLLDILSRDIGPAIIGAHVKTPLSGLRIAPYYGCQCLRPYPVFDDPEKPRSMEPLIKAVGAGIHFWDMGGKCCGASHMTTKPEVGRELVAAILKNAQGADAIVTVCPMCQMNLEAFQHQISRKYHEDLRITVLYLPQLLGIAMGFAPTLGLNLNLAVTDRFRERVLGT